MSTHETLGKEILELYTRTSFGKVLKSEIDQLVFHHFLLASLDHKYLNTKNEILYYHINKTEIYQLSRKACITESRIKTLLEQDFFQYGKTSTVHDFLLATVNSKTISSTLLKSGKIQFVIPNPIARKYLEERIFSVGGLVDYSFNHDILVLEILDFLRIVHYNDDTQVAETITSNILAKSRQKPGDPELQAFLNDLNRIPLQERLKKIAMGVAEKFIGQTGDEIIGAVIDLVKP